MIRFNDITIDRENMIVTNGDKQHQWPRMIKNGKLMTVNFRMLEYLLLSGGASLEELFNRLYDHDSEGGPLYGVDIVRVYLCHLQPKIQKLGLTLRKEKIAGKMYYWVSQSCA